MGSWGRAGAGKPTVALAIARLLSRTRGSVVLGGLPLASIPENVLRQVVSCVTQSPQVFSVLRSGPNWAEGFH